MYFSLGVVVKEVGNAVIYCTYILQLHLAETHLCHVHPKLGSQMESVQGPKTGLTWKGQELGSLLGGNGLAVARAGIGRGDGRTEGKAGAVSCGKKEGVNKRWERPVRDSRRYLLSWGGTLRGQG